MIPQGGAFSSNQNIKTVQQPSKTYQLDVENGRVTGITEGLEAIKQAVWKILQTERNTYLIYGTNYGIDTNGIIGSDTATAQSRLIKSIREALLQDDRITDVTDFQVTVNGDEMLALFTVVTQYGKFEAQKGI